jgi:hypothetical protein
MDRGVSPIAVLDMGKFEASGGSFLGKMMRET